MKKLSYALIICAILLHRPNFLITQDKLEAITPETRKPYIDPHSIKPNLDEATAPTNIHTNSEYLQGQKITDTNPNQNVGNEIKQARPVGIDLTKKK